MQSPIRHRPLVVFGMALALVVAAIGPVSAGPPARVAFWLTVLHNNDGESALLASLVNDDPAMPYAGVSRFTTLVDQLKAQATSGMPSPDQRGSKRGVVMLSSGDNYLAGPQFTASLRNGVPYYDSLAIGEIGYDALAIGNHEFDFGPEVLADFIEGVPGSVPFLSANLDVSGEPRLAALEDDGRIAASVRIRERGEWIGIIGATTPGLPNISSPRNVVVDPAVAIAVQAEADALTASGVDKIILISHLQSVDEDVALAEELTDIDIIIAGGGDELLAGPDDPLAPGDTTPAGDYPLWTTDLDGKDVPVVTTTGNFRYVGKLVAGFDGSGNLVRIDDPASLPVRVMGFGPDGVAPDPRVERLVVAPVQAFVDGLQANVLAQTQVTLNGARGAMAGGTINGDIATPGVRNSETNMGNLTADSLLWQAQQSAADFGVDAPQIALQNGGGIRNDVVKAAGSDITEFDTFQILAFSNFVSVLEDISPDRLKIVLETSVSRVGDGRFGQWAGIEFSYDPDLQGRELVTLPEGGACAVGAEGERIQDVWIGGEQWFDDGAYVGDPSWTVDVATNDFTFRYGDCYDFGSQDFTTVGVTYQQALVNYLTDPAGLGGTVSASEYPEGGEGRIVRLP
jgi:2',3'-cyclic-nucleotide 2'-phosphodiesterase (5'-nucleotidase family)